MTSERVKVLIVGGGGAGLTASMLFSLLGVDALLLNAAATTSRLPKAHVLNQRAMEIMADCGVDGAIYAIGTPPSQMSHTAFYAGFGGRDGAGRIIHKQESWGAGGADDEWRLASPKVSSNLPQIRLEPILKARAEEMSPGRVRFHHEVTSIEQTGDVVEVTVLDRDSGEAYRVVADYVVACDGGRTVGARTGITLEGHRDLARTVSIYASCDLSRWAGDPDVLLRWVWSPETGQLVVMAPMGPESWGGTSEEWVIHTSYGIDDQRAFDDEAVLADVRRSLGIGDHPMTVHTVTRWTIGGLVADRFRSGRVFVAGDAAHRHPPTGALGLTSAMHDVHNLCWKIAMVVRGMAGDALLDTYGAERRPVDARNVRRSLENSRGHALIGSRLGLDDPALDADARWKVLQRLFSGSPDDESFRRSVLQAIAAQSQEFREHDVEYGYRHVSSAVMPETSEPPEEEHGETRGGDPQQFRVYEPSTVPGSPLPHAWIEDWAMNRLSTLDLVPPDGFLVIGGERGGSWCEAARTVAAELGLRIEAATIGHAAGDFHDPRLRWSRVRGIDDDGAILVRPDRCVAFRSRGAVDDPTGTLTSVFRQVLSL